jgi:uncharacterized protein (DUF486 family)
VLPLPEADLWFGLLFVVVAALPLGAVLLRLGEWILRRKISLSTPERLLLAFYVSGGALFVLASLPIAFYGYALLVTMFLGGGVAYAAICYKEGGVGLRSSLSFVGTVPGIVLGLLTIGVLAVEIAGVASLTLANTVDGSLHSLFINLLISNHTLPWTFSPYAPMGVTYPQGAPVWMSIPVLLLGWPTVSAPLDVPPLFLALSTVAAYCLGQRLSAELPPLSGSWVGLLFASFFGLVFTWPRLAVGGSFDFAIGLPLFILLLGWIVPLVRVPGGSWKEVIAFGVTVGIECSLSAMLGVATLLLLAAYILIFRVRPSPRLREWALRWLAIASICAGFLVRSLVGFAVWFSYPGHVLTPLGNPPPVHSPVPQPLTYGNLTGELDPFILFKPKISPIPALSLEITMLLAVGLVLIGLLLVFPRNRIGRYLPRQLALWVGVGTLVMFAETCAIIVGESATLNPSGIGTIFYVEEPSMVLFLFYGLIALLPLLAAVRFASPKFIQRSPPATRLRRFALPGRGRRHPWQFPPLRVVLVALLLLVPIASGIGATALVVPGYITNHDEQLANVSSSDIAALEWAGSHLPACSLVLVAPGSVGQYLPEFARVGVVYPAYPIPANLSYSVVVDDLDSGTYTSTTGALLLQLDITEVFVSGQNSVSFPPFQLGPLRSSPDFGVLETAGDVTILEFFPGATGAGCVP